MKCKYCHAEVENDAIFCPNCGKHLPQRKQCIKCGEILDEESDFCPNCGTRQSRTAPGDSQGGRNNAPVKKDGKSVFSNPWLIFALLALLLVLLFFLLFNPFGNNTKKADRDDLMREEQVEKEKPGPVDSDSVFRAKTAVEQQQKEDSLMKVAKMKSDSLAFIKDSLNNLKANKKTVKPQEKQSATQSTRSNVARPSRTVQTGTKNMGYGSYKGSLVGGKPHGVNGRLVFKTYHQIDSRDPKGRMAEPGDYVIGEFYDGHLVQGIWYDAYNQVKGSIIIGR